MMCLQKECEWHFKHGEIERQKERRFELIEKYKGKEDLLLPKRSTQHSAAYDLRVSKETKIYKDEITLVPLVFKVYMPHDEYFQISLRSGNKIPMLMVNMIGIVDADYVDNPKNEGHVMIPILYLGFCGQSLAAGCRIAQGVFLRYGTTGDVVEEVRTGGHGSTG